MSRANLLVAAVSLAAVFSLGCSSNKMAVADSQITSDIQSKLNSDPATKQGAIGVAVNAGAVTLTGDIPGPDVELAAMKIANSTVGVHSVADQMKVTNASAAIQPPPLPAAAPANATAPPVSAAPSASALKPDAMPPVPAPARSELPPTDATSQPARSVQPPPVARPLVPAKVTIPVGERLSVRTIDAIDSGKSTEGQAMRASLEAPLVSRGQVIVPAGAPITLQLSGIKGAGRIKGNSELSVQATSLEYRNRNYPITTSVLEQQGKARGKNTGIKTGIGAAAGALIGGLAGGGKGAAIGAGAGGGAGFGLNALTHGQQVKIPSETVLTFQLQSPLTVPAPREQR